MTHAHGVSHYLKSGGAGCLSWLVLPERRLYEGVNPGEEDGDEFEKSHSDWASGSGFVARCFLFPTSGDFSVMSVYGQ